jgi:hypothetical protein
VTPTTVLEALVGLRELPERYDSACLPLDCVSDDDEYVGCHVSCKLVLALAAEARTSGRPGGAGAGAGAGGGGGGVPDVLAMVDVFNAWRAEDYVGSWLRARGLTLVPVMDSVRGGVDYRTVLLLRGRVEVMFDCEACWTVASEARRGHGKWCVRGGSPARRIMILVHDLDSLDVLRIPSPMHWMGTTFASVKHGLAACHLRSHREGPMLLIDAHMFSTPDDAVVAVALLPLALGSLRTLLLGPCFLSNVVGEVDIGPAGSAGASGGPATTVTVAVGDRGVRSAAVRWLVRHMLGGSTQHRGRPVAFVWCPAGVQVVAPIHRYSDPGSPHIGSALEVFVDYALAGVVMEYLAAAGGPGGPGGPGGLGGAGRGGGGVLGMDLPVLGGAPGRASAPPPDNLSTVFAERIVRVGGFDIGAAVRQHLTRALQEGVVDGSARRAFGGLVNLSPPTPGWVPPKSDFQTCQRVEVEA